MASYSLTRTPVPSSPATLEEASSLLAEICRRQQRLHVGRPLARLLGLLSLGGRTVALFERLQGPSLRSVLASSSPQAQAAAPALVRALIRLHDDFGSHGDLKPEHVFLDGGEVAFIDPLPERGEWIGTPGYVPPMHRGGRPDDLGSLAAILAELWGGTLGWRDWFRRRRVYWETGDERYLEMLREGAFGAPAPIRQWIEEVGQKILDCRELRDAWSSQTVRWCRGRLEALAVALGEPQPRKWWQVWKS
jgi:hypothetical protein